LFGWIVYNEFLSSEKFIEPVQQLCNAATARGLRLYPKTNAAISYTLHSTGIIFNEKLPDFVIFWDKDIRLAKALELIGIRVFNSSESIEICDDKSLTGLLLSRNNIKIPKTILAPKTYASFGYSNKDFLDYVVSELGFPMVVKESRGSFGQQVFLANDKEEINEIIDSVNGRPVIFQELIKSSFGRDIRINVVGREIVAAMYRYSITGDFRANVTNGGLMEKYSPSEEECAIAIKCLDIIGLDFAGVDILFGDQGEPIVCEVNSNAHMKNIFDCTGIDVSYNIIDHISSVMSYE